LATLKLPTDEDVEAEHLGAVWLMLGANELALPTQCQAAREQLNQMSDVAGRLVSVGSTRLRSIVKVLSIKGMFSPMRFLKKSLVGNR